LPFPFVGLAAVAEQLAAGWTQLPFTSVNVVPVTA
jgi:hypothetical protein